MIIWSDEHGHEYATMAQEMLMYAGFHDGVNARLRAVVMAGGAPDVAAAQSIDDLYRYYGDKSVFEEGE